MTAGPHYRALTTLPSQALMFSLAPTDSPHLSFEISIKKKRDPAKLPVEVFDNILENLTEDKSTVPHLLKSKQTWDNVAAPHACRLVNHAWNIRTTPFLPSMFECVGLWRSSSGFWHFLRYVIPECLHLDPWHS